MNIAISFDFDNTLSKPSVQKLAKEFIKYGFKVIICTSRPKEFMDNSDTYRVAKELGIPEKDIIFTNRESKSLYLKEALVHFDDDSVEIDDINSAPIKCTGISVNTNPSMYSRKAYKIIHSYMVTLI